MLMAPPRGERLTLSVLTMNMWNVDYYIEDRMDYMCDLVSRLNPDLLAFQEVPWDQVDNVVQNLHADGYDVYDSCRRERPHGEIIASRYPIYRTELIPFRDTEMKRCMTLAEIDMPGGQSIYFVTAQMESSEDAYDPPRTDQEALADRKHFAKLRRRQIKDMFSVLRKKDRVIFAGTLNKNQDEYIKMPSLWHDAWIMGGGEKGYEYTYDGERNPNAKRHIRERLDRVLMKKPHGENWHVTQFGLAGLKSILKTDRGNLLMPSDHFAVFSTLELNLPPPSPHLAKQRESSRRVKPHPPPPPPSQRRRHNYDDSRSSRRRRRSFSSDESDNDYSLSSSESSLSSSSKDDESRRRLPSSKRSRRTKKKQKKKKSSRTVKKRRHRHTESSDSRTSSSSSSSEDDRRRDGDQPRSKLQRPSRGYYNNNGGGTRRHKSTRRSQRTRSRSPPRSRQQKRQHQEAKAQQQRAKKRRKYLMRQ